MLAVPVSEILTVVGVDLGDLHAENKWFQNSAPDRSNDQPGPYPVSSPAGRREVAAEP
jgi:hypothetical protein